MTFFWTPDLATGNAMIDMEHKQLIAAIGNLLDACSQGKGRDEMERTIRFLSDYTKKHFSDEEALQMKYSYPDRQAHLDYHTQFRKTVSDLSRRIENGEQSLALLSEVNMSVAAWFTEHIRQQDKRVAQHIRNVTGKN